MFKVRIATLYTFLKGLPRSSKKTLQTLSYFLPLLLQSTIYNKLSLLRHNTSKSLDQILKRIRRFSLMDFRPPFLFSSAVMSDCPTSQTNCGFSINTSENNYNAKTVQSIKIFCWIKLLKLNDSVQNGIFQLSLSWNTKKKPKYSRPFESAQKNYFHLVPGSPILSTVLQEDVSPLR